MKSIFTHSTKLLIVLLLSFFSFPTIVFSQIGPGTAPVIDPVGGFKIDGTLKATTFEGDWLDDTGSGGYGYANKSCSIS